MPEQSSVNDPNQHALDNIPEFSEGGGATEYDHLKAHYYRLKEQEQARHGAAMFANGVIEGLRQAIYAIDTDRKEMQPSGKWPGMNAAIAAMERAIAKRQAEKAS